MSADEAIRVRYRSSRSYDVPLTAVFILALGIVITRAALVLEPATTRSALEDA
jgi:hypothetical protein